MPLNTEKIRKLMGERGAQARIAEAAGMTPAGLSRILSGKFDPKLSTVERVARALGCGVKDLLR